MRDKRQQGLFDKGDKAIFILDLAVLLAIIAPLFLFNELARWQKIGYVVGTGLWLTNLFFIGSFGLGLIAVVVLLVSCVQLLCEYFPFRP